MRVVPAGQQAVGAVQQQAQPPAQPRAPVTRPADQAGPSVGRGAATGAPIVIGQDDLPDAVYLDEVVDLAATGADVTSGSGRIVIGDDLDSSGILDALPAAKAMDPRVRARRAAVSRERGRRRLMVMVAVGAVVMIAVTVLAVLSSSLFAVDEVVVQGGPYTQARNGVLLDEVIEDLRGQPVLLVDTAAAEARLETIPWVERAFVVTDFPNRVFIDLRERSPLATFVGSDGRYRVIDRDGRVLDVLDGRPRDYMLVTADGPDAEPGEFAGTPFALAAQLVSALPAEVRTLTLSVAVDIASGDFGLQLQGGPTGEIEVRLGDFDRIDAKLARLLQRVRDGVDGIVRIDVSTDEISVITP